MLAPCTQAGWRRRRPQAFRCGMNPGAVRAQAVDFTLRWCRQRGQQLPVRPEGDTIAISRRLHATYAPLVLGAGEAPGQPAVQLLTAEPSAAEPS